MNTDPRTAPEALAEFNRFYSATHVHEVIAAHPGFFSVNRYERVAPDSDADGPRWLAVYGMLDEAASAFDRAADRCDVSHQAAEARKSFETSQSLPPEVATELSKIVEALVRAVAGKDSIPVLCILRSSTIRWSICQAMASPPRAAGTASFC